MSSDIKASIEHYCRQCDISFPSRPKLEGHFRVFHDDLPSDGSLPENGTLTTYIGSNAEGYADHEFSSESLQCPSKCNFCHQIIWEMAMWCPACSIRCHRLCSERISSRCVKLPSRTSKKPKDHPAAVKTLGFDRLRRKIGENKMRYVDEKYDLDLSYISPRIIAMSFPAQGVESAYRNKLHDVAELLESKHKDKYLIINVSDRSYDTSLFKNQVLEFGWPDHHAPPMSLLCQIVKTIDSWLSQDPNHVIACHCKGGKGRTGVVIAAYIQFSNRYLTPEEALGKFADKRFYDESLGGVTQPSQRRMVHYFNALLKNEIQLESRQVILNTVILFGCPQIDGKNGAKICFCIYEGFKLVHTTKVYGVTPDAEHVCISLENVKVQSDVMIKAFHIGKTGKTCILRTQFHTAFIKADYNMVFRKKDIDIACRDDRFPKDGVLQVIFTPQASVVTDNIDSIVHQSLVTDQQEAKVIEEMTKEISLMSFDSDYADFSSFFSDNPLSEMKHNEMVDGILTLHSEYKLISPLLPFSEDSPPSNSDDQEEVYTLDQDTIPPEHTFDKDSGKGDSPPCGAPPPLPPKGKTKEREESPSSSGATMSDSGPVLPPRKGKPPPTSNPNILTSYLVESKEDADYLSFEIATPVKNLVQQFESDEQQQSPTFTNWVKFDEERLTSKCPDDRDPLLDLSSSPPDMPTKRKFATISGATKSKVVASKSEPGEETVVRRRSGTMERDHEIVRRKTKSMEVKSGNNVEMDRGKRKGERKSCYIPYLQRKESVKKEDSGKKRYVPYKMRTDSFGTNSRSGSESSNSVFSPPPLPPRGDKAAPGPSNKRLSTPSSSSSRPEPMTGESGEALTVPPRRLGSLSKSMDNLPCSNQVSMNMEGPDTSSPGSVEYSLKNWERAQKRKVIQQTKKIWFQPDISRQESQATLVTQCPGAFIIRKSQTLNDSFGLTIRLEDGKKHEDFNLHPGSHKVSNFLIQRNESGKFFINGFGGVDFTNLEDLVEYFTNHTGGLPHPLCVPTQPYADRIDKVIPMLLRNVSFPVYILEKRCIRYLPLDSFAEDNVKTLLTETLSQLDPEDVRLISMSVTKHGISLTDPDCYLFDTYSIPYKQIKNCEIGSRDQTISLPNASTAKTAPTFGLIHRDKEGEIIYIALAEYEDKGLSITKTINKFRSYLV